MGYQERIRFGGISGPTHYPTLPTLPTPRDVLDRDERLLRLVP